MSSQSRSNVHGEYCPWKCMAARKSYGCFGLTAAGMSMASCANLGSILIQIVEQVRATTEDERWTRVSDASEGGQRSSFAARLRVRSAGLFRGSGCGGADLARLGRLVRELAILALLTGRGPSGIGQSDALQPFDWHSKSAALPNLFRSPHHPPATQLFFLSFLSASFCLPRVSNRAFTHSFFTGNRASI